MYQAGLFDSAPGAFVEMAEAKPLVIEKQLFSELRTLVVLDSDVTASPDPDKVENKAAVIIGKKLLAIGFDDENTSATYGLAAAQEEITKADKSGQPYDVILLVGKTEDPIRSANALGRRKLAFIVNEGVDQEKLRSAIEQGLQSLLVTLGR